MRGRRALAAPPRTAQSNPPTCTNLQDSAARGWPPTVAVATFRSAPASKNLAADNPRHGLSGERRTDHDCGAKAVPWSGTGGAAARAR